MGRCLLPKLGLVLALMGCSTSPEADDTSVPSTSTTTGSHGTQATSSVTTASASVGPTTSGVTTGTQATGAASASTATSSGATTTTTTTMGTTAASATTTGTGTETGTASATATVGGAGGAGATTMGGPTTGGTAESKFLVFLLLGQSNMEGAPQPESQDRAEDPRIKVLAYDNCPALGREYNQWYTASPPLHSCGGGVGPGDYFAKTLLESLPEDYTIGLVPCGVNGAPIDLFLKGVPRNSHYLPPDDHWETGYEWIVTRAQEAQKTGTVAGILFHQGESNNGQPDWVGKVQGFVSDLRTDLGLGDVPFLAGEMYYQGAGAGHNALVAELPSAITNAHVISASGLTGTDQWHFDLASQRELGTRYGAKMQELLTLP